MCSDDLLLDSAKRAIQRTQPNAEVALGNLHEALQRDVISPYRWCDLGQALRQVGRVEEARYCYSRALELGPDSPPILWRIAMFYMRIKEKHSAMKSMSQMLLVVPDYKSVIFNIYVVNMGNIEETLEYGIPQNRPIAQDYFRYLLRRAAPQDVKTAWDWLDAHSMVDERLGGEYVDFLIARRQLPQAADIWKHTVGASDGAYLKSNLVYNGDFEMEPLQAGLDWKFSDGEGVRIVRDSTVKRSGSSSIRVDFGGNENSNFNRVSQNLILPAGKYHFSAWLRTADLTTDQGIGFRLVDASGRVATVTKQLIGTNDWTPVEMDFTPTGPAQLFRVEAFRPPSWKFDNKVNGSAWIDGVSLSRE